MKEDTIFLEHIIQAIKKIEEYTKGVSKEKFLQSTMVQDAAMRQIEIIGEACKRISEKTKLRSENIPWKDIAGMRDKLIHAYFGVNVESVLRQ